MQLPFDLEDVVGVAVADFIKRLFALWTCLSVGVLAVGTAAIGLSVLLAVWHLATGGGWTVIDAPSPTDMLLGLLFGFLIPIFTSWGPVYGAFLIGLAIYFFRADSPHPYVWGGGAAVVGAFFLLLFHDEVDLLEFVLTLVLWLVGMAGIFFLLRWWLMRSRVEAEQHLAAIAEVNRRKREEIRERTGIAVGDREFAVGDGEDP